MVGDLIPLRLCMYVTMNYEIGALICDLSFFIDNNHFECQKEPCCLIP